MSGEDTPRERAGITRRRFVRDAGSAAAAAAVASAVPGASALARRRKPKRGGRSVVILGGGVAGLTAAHELAERGFEVTVYERKSFGGKARSILVPNSAPPGRNALPGEHGFRFFPGFYHHIPDTMRRIPFPGNPNGVWDNLVATSQTSFARAGRGNVVLPPMSQSSSPQDLIEALIGAYQQVANLPPDEIAYFSRRVAMYFGSCDERRFKQWEYTSWWDYVDAAHRSEEYKKMLAIGLTRNLVAAKAEAASTRTIGNMAEAFIYNIQGRGNDGAPDRLLNGPTNEAWIDPWIEHLKKLGVNLKFGTVKELRMRKGRITAARIRNRRGTHWSQADWFVSAMPVERLVLLLKPKLLASEPRLAKLRELTTDWMAGIQFFLNEQAPLVSGHLSYVDSPWALTSISQQQYWGGHDLAKRYGDGRVKDILSVDISDWHSKGMIYGKPADRCTREEIGKEVFEQIKAHVNDDGRELLNDAMIESFFIDPGITLPGTVRKKTKKGRTKVGPKQTTNDEPLLINTVGSWYDRPDTTTAIPNFFLASDFVRTNIDLATMEGANESARAAVAALMHAAGASGDPPRTYTLYRPPEFEDMKRDDEQRFRRGQPQVLDV